ncbi:type VI secretion system Vgr family protein [Dyadobacter alkalitolerans]|uniref:type VI secretion system Vgr family protein n=1 Tax=Dyadobacter alkalitolerans TaxID=492736 RepID=UPI00047E2AE4|nr:phage baseplate assembly protein V [Dyadobacter alkalitolerans]
MSLTHRLEVKFGGLTLKKFIFLNLSQPFNDHHRLEMHVTFDDINAALKGDEEGSEADADCELHLQKLVERWSGEKITVAITQDDNTTKTPKTATHSFTGIIMGIQLQMNDAIDNTLIIHAVSPTILLDTGNNTRTFEAKELKNVLEDVFRPVQGLMEARVSPKSTEQIPYLTQYQESNYQFVQRLGAAYGEWFYYDGDKVIFGKSARVKKKPLELNYGVNLQQMEYLLALEPLTFTGKLYNYAKDKQLEASSKSINVDLLQDVRIASSQSDKLFKEENLDIDFSGYDTESALAEAAKVRKSGYAKNLGLLKGTSQSVEMYVGIPFTVKDEIKDHEDKTVRTDNYGTFTVTNVHHYLDSRGFYQNHFEAVPQDSDYPPVDYSISKPKAESQPAKVIDTNDPEQMGRVKVQFYWQKNGDSTPWARVANLMSGDERGVYFVPEIDEVVFVDFEFGNPDLPFVRGSMYTGSALPGGNLFEKVNMIKGIITKGGNHIIIDDSDGKEAIRIYNKENRNEVVLTLDGEPVISVKSEGKITLEAKEIELKAEKISMTAQQDWTVETNKGSIEAKAKMQITGATVNVEGKSQTSIKGNAQLALEGGAQASLKAAMVMIN